MNYTLNNILRFITFVLLLLGTTGCEGTKSAEYAKFKVSEPMELPKGHKVCKNGGKVIYFGSDINENNILDESEIIPSKTQYACIGDQGESAVIQTQQTTEQCYQITLGVDSNNDGIIDANHNQIEVCSGDNGLSTSSPATPSECATGGTHLEFGSDLNANGTLDANEVTSNEVICNGVNGVSTSRPATPSECSAGGTYFELGLDSNGNGVLDTNEVASSEVVCGGINGLSTSRPATPTECATGGTYFELGLDSNGNGVLDTNEVASNEILCNGVSTVSKTRPATPTECSAGGTYFEFGADINGNGVLDIQEITSHELICNGCNSAVDVRDATPTECNQGGAIFTSFSDCNGNSEIDAGETISTSKAVCNGLTPSVTTTNLLTGDTNCPTGGTSVNIDGDIFYSCNGSNGSTPSLAITNLSVGHSVCTDGGVEINLDGQKYYVCDGGTAVPPTSLCTASNASECVDFTIDRLSFSGCDGGYFSTVNNNSGFVCVLNTAGSSIHFRYRDFTLRQDICRSEMLWGNGMFTGNGSSCQDARGHYAYTNNGRMYINQNAWISITRDGIISTGGGATHNPSTRKICWTPTGGGTSCVGYNVSFKLK